MVVSGVEVVMVCVAVVLAAVRSLFVLIFGELKDEVALRVSFNSVLEIKVLTD